MNIFRAWKRDALGWFIEMQVGGQKDWGINWNRFISRNAGDRLSTATWTVPGNITKISQQEDSEGNQAKITIETPVKGTYWCTHLMQTIQGIKEPFRFRVIVK